MSEDDSAVSSLPNHSHRMIFPETRGWGSGQILLHHYEDSK